MQAFLRFIGITYGMLSFYYRQKNNIVVIAWIFCFKLLSSVFK